MIAGSQPTLSAAVCQATERESLFRPGAPVVEVEEVICSEGPLLEGGEVVCRVGVDLLRAAYNRRHRIERGEIEGVGYLVYYMNGSGFIQGDPQADPGAMGRDGAEVWTMTCKIDLEEDARRCSLSRNGLEIGIRTDEQVFVTVGRDRVPGSGVMLEIDDDGVFSAAEDEGFSQPQIRELILEMAQGELLFLRYQERPLGFAREAAVPLFGFRQAWQVLNATYDGICTIDVR